MARTLARREALAVLGAVLGLAILVIPSIATDPPGEFKPGAVTASGPLAALVRATDGEWEVGIPRTAAVLVAMGLALLIGAGLLMRRWRAWIVVAAVVGAVVLLVVPAVTLQAALRDSTEQWFFTNDSNYQIELAGERLLDGENPYGASYRDTGLARFYHFDGSLPDADDRVPQLDAFPYFPGMTVLGAAWRLLPEPWSDFRFLLALCTIALLPAALLFPGPLHWRLIGGAVLAANPISVRMAWFSMADAPCLLLLVAAFGLALRRRFGWAGAALAGAILVKQFALVALPFLALYAWQRATPEQRRRAAIAFGAVLAVGFLPFVAWGPGALWHDTVTFGTSGYKIVGWGLSSTLLEAGIIDDAYDAYPFALLALLVWLPATAYLVWAQRRLGTSWMPGVGFALSILLLFYLARVFQAHYVVYGLAGLVVAVLSVGASESEASTASSTHDSGSSNTA
jgi:hypothetical protein